MDWTSYLESIRHDSRFALSRECFTPLDVLDRRPEMSAGIPFLLDLRVRTAPEAAPEAKERQEQKVERWDVLDGLRRHAAEHVLLIGRPGSGKSTALQRLLLEEAEQALGDADARIPVLLELRHYQESTLDLIERALRTHGLFVDAQRLLEWLRQGRLLLLVDGVNELPSDVARRELAAFRREYRTTTPMIFATRELMVGGDLEIGKRLVMEPLTEQQLQQFVRAYLGEGGDKLLRQLQGRLRELAEVPLLLRMLCALFRETPERLPENLGLVLRQFTNQYENDDQFKGNAPVSDESRRWWPRLLQRLAFKMLQGPEPTELYVAIARSQVEDWLTDTLREEQCDQPRSRAMAWLNDLINHHLLQRSAGDRIEFRHQFIQEYYAAEYLLSHLPELDDATLQRDYLNYLKWTEPFVLLMGLEENRKQALRIVKLAEAIDWQLAARLAGAVRPDWQAEAILFIAATPQIPEWHRMDLYGLTRSCDAVPALEKALHHEDVMLRRAAANALGQIGGEAAVSALCEALHDQNSSVALTAANALGQIGGEAAVSALSTALHDIGALEQFRDLVVRQFIVFNLGKTGNEAAVSALSTALHDVLFMIRETAVEALGQIGGEAAVSALFTALHNNDCIVREAAAWQLCKIGDVAAVSALSTALQYDEASSVRRVAAEALGEIGGEAAVSALRVALGDEASEVRTFAAWKLGEISYAAAVSALRVALGDEDNEVRRFAARKLGEIGGEAAVSALRVALGDEIDDIGLTRQAIAEMLGEIGDAAAVSALRNALGDANSAARMVATWKLGEIGDVAAVSTLCAALSDDKTDKVREAAAEALGEIGDVAAASALLTALHDENFKIRWAAAGALGQIGGKAAVSALSSTLRDTDFGVRRAATAALGQIGDTQCLAEFAVNFRQGVQTEPEVFQTITALEQRFKIYRADAFLRSSTEIKLPPAEKIMRIIRVVLASPSDVQHERDVLPGVIEELNCNMGVVLDVDLKLYRWETDAYPGFHPEGPQGLIDGILQIDDCDVLIGIFWTRFGTPTHDADSGTEHEFRIAYKAWQESKEQPRRPHIMVYFKNAAYSPSSPEELDQWRKVLEFQKAFPKQGLWWPFKTTNKFKDIARQHLSGWLRDNFGKK